ncbi:MAG: hypothetical protein IPH04_19375 [Saprospirales bacterium]|nr:hypothetical protein [Saprospirales bacterium]
MKIYLFPLLCCLALASCKNDLELPSLEMSEPASGNHLIEDEAIDQSQWVSGSGILIDEDIYTIEEVGEDIFWCRGRPKIFNSKRNCCFLRIRGGRIPWLFHFAQ